MSIIWYNKSLRYCRGTVQYCVKSRQMTLEVAHKSSVGHVSFPIDGLPCIVIMSLCLAPFPRYYHFYVRDCLRPSEIFQFDMTVKIVIHVEACPG